MRQVNSKITYKDRDYKIVFNLNVMEIIQEEYETLEAWAELTDGKAGEVNIKALIFGLTAMLNEGIDIDNEENGTKEPFLTSKQVGRMITDVGIDNATNTMNDLVIDSTKTEGADSKNA